MHGPRTKELIKKELKHLIRPFGAFGRSPKMIWEKGEGVILWDVDGNQYIDLSSGRWQYMSLGWGRKELIDAATEQMNKISHMINADAFSSELAIEYAAQLAAVLPGDINRVLFTCTGTNSTEAAIKISKLFWEIKGRGRKYKVLCLSDAYHGASHFAGTLMGHPGGRNPFGVEVPGVVRMPHYHCYRCPYKQTYPSCGVLCGRMIERIIEQEGPESIACMIAEPIQGTSGFIWPPEEFWSTVTKTLKKYDILFIADEVQNGFCRTGKFWGVDNWNIIPDILTMAKGINSAYIPLGAVGISEELYKVLEGHNFLYGGTGHGSPIALATAKAALRIYLEEDMAARSARLGEHIHKRLVNEFLPLPCVDDIMGKGCYQSFAFALNKTTGSQFDQEAQNKAAEILDNRFLEEGVLPRIEQARRVSITPPLVISEQELDKGLDIMLRVLKEVKPI